MFTGIIEAIGTISALQNQQGDIRLRIQTGDLDLGDVKLGDSVATNGVCLTVVELPGDGFWADVSRESITHTRIAEWKKGDKVNLEKALTLNTRLGGHIVTGHVDGVGTITERKDDARSVRFTLQAPSNIQKYIAAKGSITVDGVSLTANDVDGDLLELNIVPHTVQETLINDYKVGTQVHLEVDIIARYLERMMNPNSSSKEEKKSKITEAFLAQNGFWK